MLHRGFDICPNDLDIFIPISSYNILYDLVCSEAFKKTVRANGINWSTLTELSGEGYDPNRMRGFSLKSNSFSKIDLIFIKTNDPKNFGNKLIAEFPVSLQQVYFNGDRMIYSESFERDYSAEYPLFRFENIENTNEFVKIMNKYSRLKASIPTLNFSLGNYCIVKNTIEETSGVTVI